MKEAIKDLIFHVQIFWAICSSGNFFQPMFISENHSKFALEDQGYQIAKVDSCKLTVFFVRYIGPLHFMAPINVWENASHGLRCSISVINFLHTIKSILLFEAQNGAGIHGSLVFLMFDASTSIPFKYYVASPVL